MARYGVLEARRLVKLEKDFVAENVLVDKTVRADGIPGNGKGCSVVDLCWAALAGISSVQTVPIVRQ